MGASSLISAPDDLSGAGRAPSLSLIPTFIVVASMFSRSTLTAELSRSMAINRQGMIMGFNQSLMFARFCWNILQFFPQREPLE